MAKDKEVKTETEETKNELQKEAVPYETFMEMVKVTTEATDALNNARAEISELRDIINSGATTGPTESRKDAGQDKRSIMHVRTWKGIDQEDHIVVGFVNKTNMKGKFQSTYKIIDPMNPSQTVEVIDLMLDNGEIIEKVNYLQFMQNAELMPARKVSEEITPHETIQGTTKITQYNEYQKVDTGEEVDVVVKSESRVLTLELDNGKVIEIDEKYVN